MPFAILRPGIAIGSPVLHSLNVISLSIKIPIRANFFHLDSIVNFILRVSSFCEVFGSSVVVQASAGTVISFSD